MARIFHDLLIQTYDKRTNSDIDVVKSKRNNFELMVEKATSELRERKYDLAKKSFNAILEYLRNEPHLDELNLLTEEEFCYKCCLCYCFIISDVDSSSETRYIDEHAEELIERLQEYPDRLITSYFQLVNQFNKQNYCSVLYWSDIFRLKFENEKDEPDYPSFFIELLPNKMEMFKVCNILQERAFSSYFEILIKNDVEMTKNLNSNFWANDSAESLINVTKLDKIYRKDIFPLHFYSNNGLPLNEKYEASKKYELDPAPNKLNSNEKSNNFFKELYKVYHAIKNCSSLWTIESEFLNKIAEIQDLIQNGVNRLRHCEESTKETQTNAFKMRTRYVQTEGIKHKNVETTKETQTDKFKISTRYVQTEGIKHKNAEVQVNLDTPILATLLDIKSKLVEKGKTEDTIAKAKKSICEVNDRLGKEQSRRKAAENEYEKKIARTEFEIEKLKGQLKKSEEERRIKTERNVFLQKLLVEQTSDKYNSLKQIYKILEKKSQYMVAYLHEIKPFLTAGSIPTDVVVNQNIVTWEKNLKKVKEDLDQLTSFYEKARSDMICSDKFEIISWPDLPDIPRDEDNIIFVSFKPAIKNILGIEEKLLAKFNANYHIQQQPKPVPPNAQYSLHGTPYGVVPAPYYLGSNLLHSTPLPPPIPMPSSKAPQQHSQRVLREKAAADPITQKQVISSEELPIPRIAAEFPDRDSDKKETKLKKEQILFQYISENCSMASEEDVTFAILHVLDKNKGSLSNLPKEQVLKEVKNVFKSKRQSAWDTPKPSHINWQNENSEHDCSICFEDLSVKQTYTLICKHKYHKECIKKWLKTSSVCPICRLHSIIDEEFPPLNN